MATFDIRHIGFYQNKNPFYGSQGKLRYKITPQDDQLLVWVWFEDVCFECAQPGDPKAFPLSEEGLEQVKTYLGEQLSSL